MKKKIQLLLLLGLFGQLFFTYKGIETFPFLLYGMYSEPRPQKPVAVYYVLKADGQALRGKVEDAFYQAQLAYIWHWQVERGGQDGVDEVLATRRAYLPAWAGAALSNTHRPAQGLAPWFRRQLSLPSELSLSLWRFRGQVRDGRWQCLDSMAYVFPD